MKEQKAKPAIEHGTIVEWAGFTMKPHPEHPEGVIVNDEKGGNCMPGACWFKSVEDAQKGIAAYKLSRETGGDFWLFMELTR